MANIPPLGAPNADGVAVPEGFGLRAVARARSQPALTNNPTATYIGHDFPDGGAVYARDNGGWIYTSNSEVPGNGGVGALVFDPPANPGDQAPIADAYSILNGTSFNCAGGRTPWDTWLSCEEFDLRAPLKMHFSRRGLRQRRARILMYTTHTLRFCARRLLATTRKSLFLEAPLSENGGNTAGQVHETNPFGTALDAQVKPALGLFAHEAAAVDLRNRIAYLTEDQHDGRFYRFVADPTDVFTDDQGRERLALENGTLQVMNIQGFEDGGYPEDVQVQQLRPVTWVDAIDSDMPQFGVRASLDSPPGTRFDGGEGMWFYELPAAVRDTPLGGSVPTRGLIFWSTKGDNRIWALDVENQLVETVFDNTQIDPDYNDVDNVTVSPWGDIVVAEDLVETGRPIRMMIVVPNLGFRYWWKPRNRVRSLPARRSPRTAVASTLAPNADRISRVRKLDSRWTHLAPAPASPMNCSSRRPFAGL